MLDYLPKTSERIVLLPLQAYLFEVIINKDMVFVLQTFEELRGDGLVAYYDHHRLVLLHPTDHIPEALVLLNYADVDYEDAVESRQDGCELGQADILECVDNFCLPVLQFLKFKDNRFDGGSLKTQDL